MAKLKDLTGQKFGHLYVIKRGDDRIPEKGKRSVQWLCKCDCGNECLAVGTQLSAGKKKSCGSCPPNYTDRTGKRYGKLVAINRVGKTKTGHYAWLCQCDCGNTKVVTNFTNKSCGCMSTKNNKVAKVGDRFGYWVVLKESQLLSYRDSKNTFSYCRCACGNEKWVRTSQLNNGESKSCGCKAAEFISKGVSLDPGKAIMNRIWKQHKTMSCEHRNIPTELTYEQYFEIAFQNCHYCGDVGKIYKTYKLNKLQESPFACNFLIANGIDRIDNNKGYTLDNCVPCCEVCNWMKGKLPQKEFIEKAKAIAKLH